MCLLSFEGMSKNPSQRAHPVDTMGMHYLDYAGFGKDSEPDMKTLGKMYSEIDPKKEMEDSS